MGLDRINNNRFHDDGPRKQRNAKDYLAFINGHKEKLKTMRNGENHYKKVLELNAVKEDFLPWQLEVIDDLYELIMKSLGLPFFRKTFKPNYKNNLRYG